MTLTVGSLFSGVGGIDVAFERAGCRILWQSEIDRDACRVLANHFPGVPNLGDIRHVDWSRVTRPDVIVGGFPCQGVSTAGKRRGLADERSGLFWDMLRVIDELQPAYVLWENVPGLLTTCSCASCGRRCKKCGSPAGADDEECGVCGSDRLHGRILSSHRGADFYAIVSALGFVGMDGAWTLLDAQWFGVPQRRRRLFGVFAQRHLGAERCVEVLSFGPRLFGSPAAGREAGQRVAAGLTSGSATGRGVNKPGRRQEDDVNIIPILEVGARQGTGADQRDGVGIGTAGDPMFSLQAGKQHGVFECPVGALNAHGAGTCGADDNQAQAGHLVAYQCHGSNVGPMGTLRAGNGNEQGGVPFLAFDDPRRFDAAGTHGGGEHGDVHPSLRNTNPSVLIAPAMASALEGHGARYDYETETFVTHALTADGFDASEDGTGRGTPIIPFDTTQVTSDKNYSHPQGGDPCHPLAGAAHPLAIAGCGVRRLTPTECERLMGLPDHWTAGLSDSARYRCLGNSVAVPCVEWIARRLVHVAAVQSREDATA